MLNVMLAFLFCSYWLGHKPPMVLLFLLVAPYALRNPRDFRESRQLGTIPGTDEDIKDRGGWSSSADTAAVFGLHSTASTFLDLLRLLPPDHLVALRRHFDIGLEDVTYRHPDGNLLFHLWQRVPLMHEIDISLGRHANEAFRAAGLLHPPHLSPLSPSQRAHDPHYPPYAYFTMLSDVAAALQRRLLLPFAFSFPGIQQDQQDDILSSWPTFACRCLGTILSPSPSVSQPIPSHLEGYIPALARPCLTQYHAFLADARRNLTNHQDAASLFAKTCDVLRGEEDREKVQEMLEVAVLDAVLAWQEARRDRRKAKME
ncbi:hypothetical protein JCM10213v2_004685 [Rhodosporidiobolus nylandii]